MGILSKIVEWLDERLKFIEPLREVMYHPIPRKSASWFYVFGSAALVLFLMQVVTGVLLALVYVPTGAGAWNSLEALNYTVRYGWFLRAMHGWGANFMVAVVLIHMTQVFLFGAHKYPRQLTWIAGVFLLLFTLAMAFTGQIMRFDQNAYWGIGIGASIMGRVPIIGAWMVHFLLGGPMIGSATLSRFFDLHVFILPAILFAFIGLHLYLVLKLGINEWPMPGRLVRRETYLKEYHELLKKDGVPFVPNAIWKDMVFAAGIVLAVMVCAAVLGPIGPNGVPNPTFIHTTPRPDFFFMWVFALLALLPPQIETPVMLIAPIVGVAILLLVPFISGEGEKSWRRRPVAVLSIMFLAVSWGALTHMGETAPWSPDMTAWASAPVPAKDLKNRSPLELEGALLLQDKQCRNCHSLGGVGGHRGPALDSVATRLDENEMIRQVIQGGGNMPAFGKNLSPSEVTALVAFLDTLHPPGEGRAHEAAKQEEIEIRKEYEK